MPVPTGLRPADAPRLQELCGEDRRLLLRLGALLRERLAVTELVLEERQALAGLRDLLLDPALPSVDADGLPALAATHAVAGLGLGVADDGYRVLAFADEIDNPFAEAATEAADAADPALPRVSRLLPALSRDVRAPIEGLLQARGDDQRAAALEQLRYAAPPLHVVGELLPLVLVDGAELVRERAISLLVAAGARGTVIDVIRALQRGDQPALVKLAKQLGPLPDEQTDLLIAALLAAVERGGTSQGLLALASQLTERLAVHPALDRLLELLVPLGGRLSLVGLVRGLQRHAADRVERALRPLLGQHADTDAILVVLLATIDERHDPALLRRGLDLLLAQEDGPRDRLGLAAAIRRLGPDVDLVAALAERSEVLARCPDATVFWLLAELARDGRIDEENGAALATALLSIFSASPGTQVMAVLEHDLLGLLPLPDASRRQLAPLVADLAARFRDHRSRDLVRYGLQGLGRAIVPALWTLIEEHPQSRVRQQATRVLTDLLLEADADELDAAVPRLLRLRTGQHERDELGCLLLAAARLSQAPALQRTEPTRAVEEATRGAGEQAIDAWGHLGAGPHLAADRRSHIIDCLLAGITAEIPDSPAERRPDPDGDEATYILDDRLGVHTDSVPRMLVAIERIGTSDHIADDNRRQIVGELCRHWQRVANWEVIWGPGNTQELARVLGRIAGAPAAGTNLRLQVAQALLPKIAHLPIAAILAELFHRTGSEMGELASRAAHRLLTQAADDRNYADDEQEDLSDVLTSFVLCPDLGDAGELLRRRLAGLLASRRGRLPPRCLEALRQGLSGLDPSVAERLAWVRG